MSEYQVIARKWRPQSFDDVVGQEHVVRTLKNAIRSGRIAHAYLFVGPRGIGKTTLARIFAKALNCENPQDGEPCCQCASCREIAGERSLDVMEVDAASRNSTVDMRELAENTLTRPVSGKYKIYIIDEVHMLSKAAWNVLLKTVEEPPAHVKFIFATTEVHQVLPTIISRCQRFDLLPIATRLIAERLQLIAGSEQVAITPEAIMAIARAAEGGMRDAQSLLDQMIAFFASGNGEQITEAQVLSLFGLTDREELFAVLQAILRNEPAGVVTRVGALAKKGKNLETLFDDLLSALRAIQLCAILPKPEEMLDESPENIARYRQIAAGVSMETVQILLETISPVGRVLHDALNKQIFLETILLKAMREAHAVRISDILARLNQLRSAGELQFLEQLPVVKEKMIPQPQYAAPVAAAEEAVAAEPPAEPEKVVAEPPVTAPEAVVELPAPEPIPEVVAPADIQTDAPECAMPEKAGIESDYAVEPEREEVEKDSSGSVVEEVVVSPVVAEIDADDEDDEDDDDYSAPGSVSMPVPPPLPESGVMPSGGNEYRWESKKKENYSPQKDQRSIANDNPQALTDILTENKTVYQVVDLFSGTVLDIHQ